MWLMQLLQITRKNDICGLLHSGYRSGISLLMLRGVALPVNSFALDLSVSLILGRL